jgi:histidinol phosphatase-like PHP family hydrolase
MWVNCHTHSDAGSYDGALTPRQVAETYRDAGFGAVAITDHDTETPPPAVEGITVLRGIEHTVDAGEMIHVVELPAHDFSVLAHPASSFSSTCAARDFAHDYGVDGIERFNGGSEQFGPTRCRDLLHIATDDAHNVWQVGHSYMDVTVAASADASEIVDTIRRGQYEIKQNHSPLRRVFGNLWKGLAYGIKQADTIRRNDRPSRSTAFYERADPEAFPGRE